MADSMAPVDFSAHLHLLYPGHHFTVEALTGGLVNFTVRARRSDTGDDGKTPPSLIVKHAPPYVAALGESAPFSQQRQLVEAAILRLLSDQGPLASLTSEGCQVQIPRVLNHDTAEFILAIQDLGPLVTLSDIFSSSATKHMAMDSHILSTRCADIGRRVATFFARLHESGSLAKAKEQASRPQLLLLERSTSRALIHEAVVKPVLQKLEEHGGFDSQTAQKLFARIEDDFLRDHYSGEPCISMGDFHLGSILVTPLRDWAANDGVALTIGVIDWEFATYRGRGVNGDMAQFLASTHVLLLSLPENSQAHAAVQSLIHSMCSAYASNARLVTKMSRTIDNPMMGILRSALITFGRETINQAVDLQWSMEGKSIKEMVRAGARCVECAGEDVQDMIRDENWGELMREKSCIVTGLFGVGAWTESRFMAETASSEAVD